MTFLLCYSRLVADIMVVFLTSITVIALVATLTVVLDFQYAGFQILDIFFLQ